MTLAEVIALGEPLLRLSPAPGQTLETADTLHLHVGGSEVNTLVGLARLGHTASLLSRLPDGPLAARITRAIEAEGVRTDQVVRAAAGRVGCYWYQPGEGPRDAAVVYDRAGSAMSGYRPSDLPAELFAGEGNRIFHTTGITLAVSAGAREAALAAMAGARAAGRRVSFDSNYRGGMWAPQAAADACEEAATLADILVVPAADATTVFGLDGSSGADGILRQLRRRFPEPIIVVTNGAEGAVASAPEGPVLRQAPFSTRGVDRIGRGDAFTAGLLHGLLGEDEAAVGLQRGLRWGAAMAALAFATPGDMPLVDVREARRLAEGPG